jgi:cytoplasmic iron level regulating protein YaaA (DUF328/UPF0246 family)
MKIVVIAGCSKRKLDKPAPAIELNQGQLFQSIKRFCQKHRLEMRILSGKHGILKPSDFIKPYNQKIRTKADIERVRGQINGEMDEIVEGFEKIIIFMGGKYRQTIKPWINGKCRVIFDKRGIGGYLQLAKQFNEINKKQFLERVEKFARGKGE